MKAIIRLILPTVCLALIAVLHVYIRTANPHDDFIAIANELCAVALCGFIGFWMVRRIRQK